MKSILLPITLISLAASLTACQTTQPMPTHPKPPHVDADKGAHTHNLIIMYDGNIGKADLLKAAQAYPAKVLYEYDVINGIAVHIPANKDINQAITYFRAVKGVVNVERDQIQSIQPVIANQ